MCKALSQAQSTEKRTGWGWWVSESLELMEVGSQGQVVKRDKCPPKTLGPSWKSKEVTLEVYKQRKFLKDLLSEVWRMNIQK